MTTEKQTGNTSPTDNKVIFGPLGKYAVIAVIMVSIIVTTAIMLEKQLNTIDQQVADLEAEIAESNKKKLKSSEVTASTEMSDIAISAEAAPQTSTIDGAPTADVLVATETENMVIAEEAQKDTNLVVETATSTNAISIESTLAASTSAEQTAQPSPVAIMKQTRADRNKARDEARQARIEAFKLEQKNHMTELFARIKALESKQLDRYKASQQNQVVSLREQVGRQQQMIEALILRNKDLYELRSANVQRNQTNREQILNRI